MSGYKWIGSFNSVVRSAWFPRECKCGHMDVEHEQGDDRFEACLMCNGCPRFKARRRVRPPKTYAK